MDDEHLVTVSYRRACQCIRLVAGGCCLLACLLVCLYAWHAGGCGVSEVFAMSRDNGLVTTIGVRASHPLVCITPLLTMRFLLFGQNRSKIGLNSL